jgi:hypothetical protein
MMAEFLKIRSKSFVFCPLERKNSMLGSFLLAVWKEKLDAGKLGINSSERKTGCGMLVIGSSEKRN